MFSLLKSLRAAWRIHESDADRGIDEIKQIVKTAGNVEEFFMQAKNVDYEFAFEPSGVCTIMTREKETLVLSIKMHNGKKKIYNMTYRNGSNSIKTDIVIEFKIQG